MYEGESAHSARRGSSIMLLMLGGISEDKIREHVGWKSADMLKCYANIGKLIGPESVATKLSEAASREQGESQLDKISRDYDTFKNLSKFKI